MLVTWDRSLLEQDTGAPSGGGEAPVAADASAQASAPSPAEAAMPAQSLPTENVGQPAAGSPSSQYTSIREWAKSRGFDVSGYGSDDEAVLSLLNARQQLDRYKPQAELYERMQPHLPKFNEYLQSIRQKEQEESRRKQWDPPEWDPTWQYKLQRDDKGNIIGDPEIVAKYKAFMDHKQRVDDMLYRDPTKYLEPHLQGQLEKFKQDIYAELAQREEKAFAHRAAAAIQQMDAPTQQLYGHVVQRIADGLGVSDSYKTAQFAGEIVNLVLRAAGSGAKPAATNDHMKAQFAQQPVSPTNRIPNLNGAVNGIGQTAAPQGGNSLREQLLSALAGVPDGDLSDSL